MKVPFVDLQAQYRSIKHEIDEAIAGVIARTSFIGGSYVAQFEEAFASYCKSQYCIGVGNGTDAIYIALRALGIGPGDEVITAANSFIATSEAITMTGSRVVFADVDPMTYNIDTERVSRLITKMTKAIIPVHLYGRPADMPAIESIAAKQGIMILEDAAQRLTDAEQAHSATRHASASIRARTSGLTAMAGQSLPVMKHSRKNVG